MKKEITKQIEKDFLIYNSSDGNIKVSVLLKNETIWLSQKSMGNLFGCSSDNIGLHLKNIFKTGELSQESVTEKFSVTATDGKIYNVKHYNLDAIISVGYRVNSIEGTRFRIWATNQLKELIVKGFVIDEEKVEREYEIYKKEKMKDYISDFDKFETKLINY